MIVLLLVLGFVLMLTGVLGQVYSLKTKRGVLPPETRTGRRLVRATLFVAGLVLVWMAAARFLHR